MCCLPHMPSSKSVSVAERVLLVTGCDRRYFPLLRGMLRSIADVGGLEHLELGFFDIDSDDDERRWLAERFQVVIRPDAPFELPEAWTADRRCLTSLIRPFLPRYFPGYDVYLYADVDVWLQDWSGFALYLRAARQGALAITPQLDRAYRLGPGAVTFRYQHYVSVFGKEAAEALMWQPYVNGGIFALAADAPHWQQWADHVMRVARTGGHWFGSGQAILTHMICNDQMRHELLPAVCNWQCHLALPVWDQERLQFVEPYVPHAPILVMHLTEGTKQHLTTVRTLAGGTIENVGLTYPAFLRLRQRSTLGA